MTITPEEARALVARAVAAGTITIQTPEQPKRAGRQPLSEPRPRGYYDARYRRTGRLLGICHKHMRRPVPVVPGKTLCQGCQDSYVKHRARYYAAAKKAGICNNHITRPVPVEPGKTKCAACLEKRRAGSRAPYRPRKLTQPTTP